MAIASNTPHLMRASAQIARLVGECRRGKSTRRETIQRIRRSTSYDDVEALAAADLLWSAAGST